jgi:phosphate-selective porin OprO/OprP
MIDTGKIAVVSEYLLGTELLYIRGPFSLQAEYGWNFIYGQTTINQNTTGLGPLTYYAFDGGYLQAAYTLTGENRAYDRKSGGLSRWYFGTQGPTENAFLVRDADGNLCGGKGAWEVAVRYSYTDLNSGPTGLAFVNGGIMQGVSLGLNWYMNTNLTVNTEWVYNNRYDLPGALNGNPGVYAIQGSTAGFGTRVQLSF